MVDSNMTKLPHLPWPVWAGASLLLHAGALTIGLPTILQVEPPASSSVNIPVTLVDEGATPAVAPSISQTFEDSTQQPNFLGGQTPTVEPQLSNQAIAPKKMETEAPANAVPPKQPSTKPANQTETPNNLEIPDEAVTETPPAVDKPAETNQEPQNSESDVGNAGVSINIVDTPTVPSGTPGDWPDILPVLQTTSTLNLTNHPCNDALPAGDVTLGVLIGADGLIIQVFAPSNGDVGSNQSASCLLTHALDANPTVIRFSPALTGQQAIITDRVQLTLRFSAS